MPPNPPPPVAPVPDVAPDMPLSGRFASTVAPIGMDGPADGWAPPGDAPVELRVDVDGPSPLQRVSGFLPLRNADGTVHRREFQVPVEAEDVADWSGETLSWYRSTAPPPFADGLRLGVSPRRCVLLLTRSAGSSGWIDLPHVSRWFREATVELDVQEGLDFDPTWPTDDPPGEGPMDVLPTVLDLPAVFARAGIGLTVRGSGAVPGSAAGSGTPTWSDMELHDAQSHFWDAQPTEEPAWALWVLACDRYDDPTYAGLMFANDTHPTWTRRTGAAIFLHCQAHSVIPADASACRTPAEQRRLRFFHLVHETGHAFNLTHSFEKRIGDPLQLDGNEPDARSWMNYVWRFSPPTEFFATFHGEFSVAERRFLRHAPEHAVRMGDALFGIDHGAHVPSAPPHVLTLAPRERAYEWLEPVYLDVLIKNRGTEPLEIPAVPSIDDGTLQVEILGPQGWQRVRGYTSPARRAPTRTLPPQSIGSFGVYVGASPGVGSHFREPGEYALRVQLFHDGRLVAETRNATIVVAAGPDARVADGPAALDLLPSRVFRFQGSHALRATTDGLTALRHHLGEGAVGGLARHLALLDGSPFERARRLRRGAAFDVIPEDLGRAMDGLEGFLGTRSMRSAAAALGGGTGLYADVLHRYQSATLRAKVPERLKASVDVLDKVGADAAGSAAIRRIGDVLEGIRKSVRDFDPNRPVEP